MLPRHARVLVLFSLLGGCTLVNSTAEFGDPLDGGPDSSLADAGDAGDATVELDGGPAPDVPVLRFPWNGYQTGSIYSGSAPLPRNALRPRLLWNPVADATRFEIELSSECSVATRNACSFDDSSAVTGTSLTTEWEPAEALAVSDVQPVGTRWFWRVRACNTGGCSGWSETRFFEAGRSSCDFNGDGYDDVAVGALREDDGTEDVGRVHVFDGNTAGPSRSATLVLSSPSGERAGEFGQAVSCLGDLNGDGFSDLAVAAPRDDAGGRMDAGRVHVYFGSAAGLPSAPSAILAGPTPEDFAFFGTALARSGDLDADGFADVLAGEPSSNTATRGRAHVFAGTATGVSASPLTTMESPRAGSEAGFGASLNIVGDLDGDGFVDAVVGASAENLGSIEDSGAAFVYQGSASGVSTTPQLTLESPSPVQEGRFGWAMTGRDIDRDGLSDLLLASLEPEGGATGAGRLYLYQGHGASILSADPPQEYVSESPEVGASFAARAAAGDFDGDGRGDIAVCAPLEDIVGANDGGRLYVFYGTDDGLELPPTPIVSPTPGALRSFCNAVAAMDTNGDGFVDVVVGSRYEDTMSATAAGRVHVFLGSTSGLGSAPDQTLAADAPEANGEFGFAIGH